MKIKFIASFVIGLAVLPAMSAEKPSEAMTLLGIEYVPIEYELRNFGDDPKLADRELPAHLDNSKRRTIQSSPLDDFLDVLKSIKSRIFDDPVSLLNGNQSIGSSLSQ